MAASHSEVKFRDMSQQKDLRKKFDVMSELRVWRAAAIAFAVGGGECVQAEPDN